MLASRNGCRVNETSLRKHDTRLEYGYWSQDNTVSNSTIDHDSVATISTFHQVRDTSY